MFLHKPLLTLALLGTLFTSQTTWGTTWNTPTDVSATGQNAFQPQVSTNASIDALVWTRDNGSTTAVQTKMLQSGSPLNLSNTSNYAEAPQIDLNDLSVGFALWVEYDSSDYLIKSSRYNGSTWASAQTRSSGTVFNPQISVNATGNAAAVWNEFDGTTFTVQASVYRGLLGWTSPATLSVGANADVPQVKMCDLDTAIAVWQEFDGSNTVICASEYQLIGGWSTPITLSASGSDAGSPQIAMTTLGDAVATWQIVDPINSVTIIQAASFSTLTGWGSTVDLSSSPDDSYSARVSMNDSNNAVATWHTVSGSNILVKASIFSSGSWSTPVEISDPLESAANANVKMNASNQAVAVWKADNGTNWVIESATYSGGSWGSIDMLSASGEDALEPDIAISGANPTAVWTRYDGTNYIIQASIGSIP